MTTDQPRSDRHVTDEPDGAPAYAASLRPVGESVAPQDAPDADTGTDFEDPDDTATSGGTLDNTVLPGQSRVGYDVDDVSGDTDAVRPE